MDAGILWVWTVVCTVKISVGVENDAIGIPHSWGKYFHAVGPAALNYVAKVWFAVFDMTVKIWLAEMSNKGGRREVAFVHFLA